MLGVFVAAVAVAVFLAVGGLLLRRRAGSNAGDATPGGSSRRAGGRAAADRNIRETDTRLRLMHEQLPAVSWTVDRDLRFTSSAGAALTALGLRQGEVVGRTLYEYFGTEDRTMPAIAAHLRALEGASVEYQFAWAGRSYQTKVEPFRNADGTITGAIGLAHDVTEQKQAYEALSRTMERYQDLVQSLEAIVWEADAADLGFTFVSHQAEDALGHPVHRWLESPDFWPGLIHPDDRQRALLNLRRTAADRHPRQFEYRARAADGRWLVLRHLVRLTGGRKTPPALRGLILDVTDQRAMENEALRAQKLDSVGLLAGGIAHDFNNLLQGIYGQIALARMEADIGPAALARLEQAEEALRRSQHLTGRLLTFARGGEPVRELASIGEIVRDSVDFSLHGSKVHYELDIPQDLWGAEVDPGQIGQVVGNLCLNADQAMPSGGVLRVRAANVEIGAGSPLPLPPGRYVRVEFADEGIGIAEADLARVFDPYYTTREAGVGLGLATAWSIVARHGGHIGVVSQQGRGAVFTIHLPATGSPPRIAPTPEPDTGGIRGPAPARRSRGRVLVLDDEPMIRGLLGELLATLGYDVEVSSEGSDTVRRYREAAAAGRRFDLVILDLTIRGGLGGREALEQIRSGDPSVRAIVSSGYSHDPVMARWADYGFKGVLVKPYTLEDLAAIVDRVMGGEA
jgi:PAS domain S-box-containing protein